MTANYCGYTVIANMNLSCVLNIKSKQCIKLYIYYTLQNIAKKL